MKKKINRRTFMSTSLVVLGGITLDTHISPFESVPLEKQANQGRKLFATTDFIDNIIINNRGSRYGVPVIRDDDYYKHHRCFMTRAQLDGLHKFLASVGVTRHQWIVDTMWNFYDQYPHGFDLLKEATQSAHKHGLEFYAKLKPFEGGHFGILLPHSMPCPPETGAVKDLRGISPSLRRFVALHPEMNLKRKAGTFEFNEQVTSIRLVKSNNLPTKVKAEHLILWTSAANNRFVRYDGPMIFRETIEKRYRFPYWRQSRVLHLDGLKIPQGHRYFLIKCSLADEKGDFSNEKGTILELAGSSGSLIPYTLSTGLVRLEDHYESFYKSKLLQLVIHYLQHPDVQAEINNRQRLEEHYRDFYTFGNYHLGDMITLDKTGFLAAACRKPEYVLGHLHPIYPEVRNHWLSNIRYFLDCGVDGVNIRGSNHTLVPDSWEYGFNAPVLEASKGDTGFAAISRINGSAYTQFLHEARDLVKSRGKSLAIHLETELLMPDDRPFKLSSYPFNFKWQWEKWIREIGDEFEIRGTFQLRPWNMKKAIDLFSAETRLVNKPLYLQGVFHGMAFDGPFASLEADIEMVKNHPELDGYMFYETANITRVNDQGEVEGSPEPARLLRQYSAARPGGTK